MFAKGTGSRHLVPTSGVRDPPPDPLPDGAPEGAIGASAYSMGRLPTGCQHSFEASHRAEHGAFDGDEIRGNLVASCRGGRVGQHRDTASDLLEGGRN